MKNFLYIFFFGYSKLKWMRLIRTLFCIGFFISLPVIYEEFDYNGISFEEFTYILFIIGIEIFSVMLLSWLILPFVKSIESKE